MLTDHGYAAIFGSWAFGILGGSSVLFTVTLGAVSDRFGRRPVLAAIDAGRALWGPILRTPLGSLTATFPLMIIHPNVLAGRGSQSREFSIKIRLFARITNSTPFTETAFAGVTIAIGEHIELLIAPGADLWQVMADPGQLEQVIMNLAVNARDAMPEGGTVKIETGSMDLPDGAKHAQGKIPPGQYVTLTVHDSGCGIDPTTLTKIFEPFFTTKESGKGTGLGLSTVYGIVHQSNGFIGVDSTLGQGTVFTIYLPRTAMAVEGPDTQASPESPARGRETILLVEDDDGTRALISDVLKTYDYTVLETGAPLEAIVIGEDHPGPVHLLFTDVVMPVMRGPALAAQLRALRPEIALLYMSGYTDGTILSRHAIEPPGLFLQKPFAPDVLVRAVRDALDAASKRPSRHMERAHG